MPAAQEAVMKDLPSCAVVSANFDRSCTNVLDNARADICLGCCHTLVWHLSHVVLQARTVVKFCTPPAALVGLSACSLLTVSDY
eukprot:3307451-Amphidinium_carterae.2